MFVTVRQNAIGGMYVRGNVVRSVTGKTENVSGIRQTSLYVVPKLGS